MLAARIGVCAKGERLQHRTVRAVGPPPDHAGYNNLADVARLADYLGSIQPENWTVADLADLREVANEAERADELAFAQEWFPALVELYRRAHLNGQAVVYESIY